MFTSDFQITLIQSHISFLQHKHVFLHVMLDEETVTKTTAQNHCYTSILKSSRRLYFDNQSRTFGSTSTCLLEYFRKAQNFSRPYN